MLHTTFNLAQDAGACAHGYEKLAQALGGVNQYGKDTPIPLSKIIKTNGLQDTIWALRCTIEPAENTLIEFACRCAEHVLHYYEDKYPADKRPRLAIEKARICITDKSPDAAYAACAACAADAAAYAACAACAAVHAADEKLWQTKTLLELLGGE